MRFRITIGAQESNPATQSHYYPWDATPLRADGTPVGPEDGGPDFDNWLNHRGHGLGYTKAEAREKAEEHCRAAAWGNVDAYDYEPPEWGRDATPY